MEEAEIKKIPTVERVSQMILAESICVAVLLLAVIAVKYLFPGCGDDMAEWYKQNVCVDTDVNEVMFPSKANDAL